MIQLVTRSFCVTLSARFPFLRGMELAKGSRGSGLCHLVAVDN